MSSSISQNQTGSSSAKLSNYNPFITSQPSNLQMPIINNTSNNLQSTSSNSIFVITNSSTNTNNSNPKKRKRPPISFMSDRNVKRRIDENNNNNNNNASISPKNLTKTMSKSRKKTHKSQNKDARQTSADSDVIIIEKPCNNNNNNNNHKRIRIVNKKRTKTNTRPPKKNENKPTNPSPPPKPPMPPKPTNITSDKMETDLDEEPPIPLIIDHSSNTNDERKMLSNCVSHQNEITSNGFSCVDIKYRYSLYEDILCWYQNTLFTGTIHKRRVISVSTNSSDKQYLVHYKGWNNTWDEWVSEDRILTKTFQNTQLMSCNYSNNNNIDNLNMNTNRTLIENINHSIGKLPTKKSASDQHRSSKTKEIKSKEIRKKKKKKDTNKNNNQNNNNNMNSSNINPFGSPTISSMSSSFSSLPQTNNISLNGSNVNVNVNVKQQLLDLQQKYAEKSEQCEQYRSIAKKLYQEVVYGEAPRWTAIDFTDTEHRVKRDKELAELRSQISSLYPKGSFVVTAVDKWEGRKELEESVHKFVTLNGEYRINAFTMIKNQIIDLKKILHKFLIGIHKRIPALNGQFGVKTLMDIPKNTCVGQYFGAEILQSAFGKVYDGTSEEYDHNIYAFDQTIDPEELMKLKEKQKKMNMQRQNRVKHKHKKNKNKNQNHHDIGSFRSNLNTNWTHKNKNKHKNKRKNKRKRKQKQSYVEYDENENEYENNDELTENNNKKIFIIDPFVGGWKANELLLRFVNDCRIDIDEIVPTSKDTKYYNVEYVGMKVNGWPQTYLVATRDIKKGEELMTYYGQDFSNAINMKMEEEERKKLKKERIDKEMLKPFKYDIFSP